MNEERRVVILYYANGLDVFGKSAVVASPPGVTYTVEEVRKVIHATEQVFPGSCLMFCNHSTIFNYVQYKDIPEEFRNIQRQL